MAVQTLSEALDNLYMSTWQSMKSQVADQIFDATPYWFWLRDKGKLRKLSGHKFIVEPLQYAKYDNTAWMTKGSAVTLQDQEILTGAKWDWKYLANSVVRHWQDDQQNRSKAEILRLVESKLDNAKMTLVDVLQTATFASTTTNGIDGLKLLIKDDPTTSTSVGGINQSTYSWWQNKQETLSGLSFASYGVYTMRNLLNDIRTANGRKQPDIIVSGQAPYEYYQDTFLGYSRFVNQKLADAGFGGAAFEGIPMVWDPYCGTRMYFINTDYLWLYYDPAFFFEMTPWKEPEDQPYTRAAQIVCVLSHVTNRRRALGVLHDIDTA